MADQRRRDAERDWRAGGAVESAAALVVDGLRRGALPIEHVRAAALLGSPAASLAAAIPISEPDRRDIYTVRLQRVPELEIRDDLLREWTCRCAERVLHWFESRRPGDLRPRPISQAIAAARAVPGHGEALQRASHAAICAAAETSGDLAAWAAAQAAGAAARLRLRDVLPIYAAHDAQVAGTGHRTARLLEARWQVEALIDLLLELPSDVGGRSRPPHAPATSSVVIGRSTKGRAEPGS